MGYSWAMFDTNILHVLEPVRVLSFAWKWFGEKKTNVLGWDDFADHGDPEHALIEIIWSILDESDLVLAHNGDSFDLKILNARFIYHGLSAPSDYKTVDTLKVAKKYFKFSSNSLDNLGIYLEEGKKESNGGFSTWLGCMKGDPKSWALMKKYNAKDVDLLESVYLRLRPFIGNHPDLNVISNRELTRDVFPCSVCQSENTTKRGFSMTKAGKYQRYQCTDCFSWSQGPYMKRSAVSLEEDDNEYG